MSTTGRCCKTSLHTRRSASEISSGFSGVTMRSTPGGPNSRWLRSARCGDDIDSDVRSALPIDELADLPVTAAVLDDATDSVLAKKGLEELSIIRGRTRQRPVPGAEPPASLAVDLLEGLAAHPARPSVAIRSTASGPSIDRLRLGVLPHKWALFMAPNCKAMAYALGVRSSPTVARGWHPSHGSSPGGERRVPPLAGLLRG